MRFIIDGNNLLHAYAEVAGPMIGRQHLCELVGGWASRVAAEVVIVFDGPPPPPGVRRQMQASTPDIRFSEARSADEVIEDIIDDAPSPANLCIVTSDQGVASAGRHRGCRWVKAQDFARRLSSPPGPSPPPGPAPPEKPTALDRQETDEWLQEFGIDTADPDDLTDLMQ
jgi:predicted RNA-binding protein with PIN domain